MRSDTGRGVGDEKDEKAEKWDGNGKGKRMEKRMGTRMGTRT